MCLLKKPDFATKVFRVKQLSLTNVNEDFFFFVVVVVVSSFWSPQASNRVEECCQLDVEYPQRTHSTTGRWCPDEEVRAMGHAQEGDTGIHALAFPCPLCFPAGYHDHLLQHVLLPGSAASKQTQRQGSQETTMDRKL